MNPRFRLRAFTESPPVRTAAILLDLVADPVPGGNVHRDDLARAWAHRYPRHAHASGRRSVRSRLHKGLWLLKVVGAVTLDGPTVTLGPDLDALSIAAANLPVIEHDGVSLPPSRWNGEPIVPPDLQALQEELTRARLAATC